MIQFRGTTIIAVRKDGRVALGGDGQVTIGDTVVKQRANKVRTLKGGRILAGFAGSVADALTLFERFEEKFDRYPGNLTRAATELAKDWRSDRFLRRLEALLVVADLEHLFLLSGTGELIEPDDGILAVGSGGTYALAAARALYPDERLDARTIVDRSLNIAADICIFSNRNITVLELGGGKVTVPVAPVTEPLPWLEELPPRQIVAELDRYIVGQAAAKKAIAIAIRNRWRRSQAPESIRDEITPSNIILIGPTGVGKTEIARRLARLAGAPFVKVEASKFTEVGYVGRDAESMVRDLVDAAISLVRAEREDEVWPQAEARANDRLLDLLLPPLVDADQDEALRERQKTSREKLRKQLQDGALDDREVEIEVTPQNYPSPDAFRPPDAQEGAESAFADWLMDLLPKKKKRRNARIPDARRILEDEELRKLIDMDETVNEALDRVENHGIIFIDEIDKIAGERNTAGPDVSREGVQRDLLPIVEGSTVQTRYGYVRTDHILFVAAGAFHVSKPSDLIPELQGRFPIRVELEPLTEKDFVRILTEPENALTRQYSALVAAEGCSLDFTEDAIQEIARTAFIANDRMENIGARRLHTVMSTLVEDLLFDLPDGSTRKVTLDAAAVRTRLTALVQNDDLRKYIL